MLSCVAALLLLTVGLSAAQSSSGSVDPEIIFSSPPPLPTPVSRPRNSSNSLGGYYSLAGGVINTIRPGNLPHGKLSHTIIVKQRLQLYSGAVAETNISFFLLLMSDTIAVAIASANDKFGLGWGLPPPDTDAQGLANEVRYIHVYSHVKMNIIIGVIIGQFFSKDVLLCRSFLCGWHQPSLQWVWACYWL